MENEYDNKGKLYDTRFSKNADVRRVQEILRNPENGMGKVYYDMGFEYQYAQQIIRYLRYREWHIYDLEIMEFEEWKENGEPIR